LAGQRVLNLGDLALSNEDYDAALKSYAYIIEIGEKSFFYSKAKISHLNVKFQMLLGDKKTTKGQYQNLENEYLATLNALGQTPKTIPLMIDMAHIQAFYLNKAQHALDLLDYASGLPGVKPEVQAQCFMKMADIQMIIGDVWEATLIYAKVEKDNEQNPIGHEAKYRKARLAFFIGDFKWAQAQLDALKAATTKLIANDAFQLSQLIKDNLADDTITEALQIYARAGLLELQENDSLSLQTIDSIFVKFPANAILDDALLFKADIMHKRKNYDQEAAFLQQIADNYSYDILADDAFFRLAQLNEFQFKNNVKAMELYKTIITDFPASIYVSEARKRFRELRGDKTT
jgi:tetratricopeptide (TPR) repeat protein